MDESSSSWARWAQEAFVKGAGKAHRYSKIRELQDVADDRGEVPLPADAHEWPLLEPFSIQRIREVLRGFKSTALGLVKLHPRSLDVCSDVALETLSLLYATCERLLCWPCGRVQCRLIRSPPFLAHGSSLAGARGAGVSGVTDSTLMALRTLVGSLVRAKRSGQGSSWNPSALPSPPFLSPPPLQLAPLWRPALWPPLVLPPPSGAVLDLAGSQTISRKAAKFWERLDIAFHVNRRTNTAKATSFFSKLHVQLGAHDVGADRMMDSTCDEHLSTSEEDITCHAEAGTFDQSDGPPTRSTALTRTGVQLVSQTDVSTARRILVLSERELVEHATLGELRKFRKDIDLISHDLDYRYHDTAGYGCQNDCNNQVGIDFIGGDIDSIGLRGIDHISHECQNGIANLQYKTASFKFAVGKCQLFSEFGLDFAAAGTVELGALERGGRLKSGLTPAGSPTDSAGTSAWSEVKGSKASSRSQPKSVQAAELRARALQKQAALREELLHLSAARVLSARLGPWPRGSPPAEADRAKVLEAAMQEKALQTRSGQLESLVRTLAEEVENIAPQAKEAAKTEKVVRKLQAKLEDSEARRKALESESGPVKASDAASAGGGRGATAGEEARVRGAQLRERVEGLKRAVQEARARQQAERDAAQSQAWDAQLSRVRQEKLAAEQQIEALDKELAQLHEAEQRGKAALERARAKSGKLAREVEPLRKAVAKLKREQVRALEEVQKARPEFSAEARKFEEGFAKITARSKLLEEKYKVAMERKRLHNLVLDLKGNIRVFVRVRPINPKEQAHEVPGEPTCDFKDDNQAGIFDEQKQSRKWYEFDQVFSPSSMQAQVFEEAKPLATSVLDGFNVCIFAYGQTGSGKTHTMAGPSSDPGLNTRVLRELFRIRDERKGEYDIKFSMSVTARSPTTSTHEAEAHGRRWARADRSEIYNEIIRDLLAPSAKKLDVKLNADGSCSVPGLSAHDVSKLDDVLTCIDSAQKNRAVASTDMNSESSRSHSIVTVRTENTFKGDKTYVGKINLIDLAGSENTGKSGVSGQGMKEAQNINKSLSALGDVIQSLVARNPHTPYRNSKLTMMLKDSLGGNSKTLMIVCCSPAQYNVSEPSRGRLSLYLPAGETMSSLNFASRARNVELGKAKRNTA
ncbi:unnamed protein product [Prorocentrum cordatum]|uniref:Kinesin motor domain-containing protein n=1 Tax=Prorocentrum cordatum TaxID=2364126 RepID=A0ABN9X5Y8_9DINO|nr:unnamed protein product [Polarella glacialis]